MMTIKTRIRIAPDGTFTGQAPSLPAGEHEAEIVLMHHAERAAGLIADGLFGRVHAIQAEVAQLPVMDDRSPDEIIGYNERGHFN
jgi:hypothetical protein